ncbi:unnamed protein product [Leptosia nina]|uniref:Uncharacterized protein n=1 Tax=Leptosia nina TaxID=320188 RepID=A0AAV1JIX9_9NEOP
MDKRKESLFGTQMCRFCLTQTTPLKSLFERNRSNNESTSMKFKVLACLSYEVFPADKMPPYICERCKFFMNTFYEFKKICRQSEEYVLKFVRNGTPFEPMSWPKALAKVYDSAKDVVKTIVEGGTAIEVTSLDTSESEDEEANIYNIKLGDDEEGKTTQIKVVTSNDLDEKKKFKKDESIEDTELSPGNKNCWPCDDCHRTYPLEQLLTLHKIRHHDRQKSIECDLCDSKFFTKSDLNIHQLRHSDETPFECVACGLKFKRLILLKRHERIVHADLPQHSCPNCPATFLSEDELMLHQQKHAKKKDSIYVCKTCDKSFTVKATLLRHIAVLHEREPEYKCEYCPERFGSMQKLSRHLKTHVGERPYPCKFCDKAFVKSQHYTRHLRVKHREEVRGTMNTSQTDGEAESYRCEQCEETFSTQDELIFHSAIHATQNLTCPLCQEKFDNVDEVTTHIKSHVNGVEFMCEFCELVFTTKEKYENHIMYAHEEEINNDLGEGESSMEAEGEDEDDNGIQVKEVGGDMVIEINKSQVDNLMAPQDADYEYEDKLDDSCGQDDEVSAAAEPSAVTSLTAVEMATLKPVLTSRPQPEKKSHITVLSQHVLPPTSGNILVKQVKVAKQANVIKNDNSESDIIRRKSEEVKRKIEPVVEAEPNKKEKITKVETSNTVGYSDKSLRLLEKELQDLKRTNSRSDVPKTMSSKSDNIPKNKRPQYFAPTSKIRSIDEKRPITYKSLSVDKKQERRVTKENKEPQKEGKNDESIREEEKKDKEALKNVVKNGASEKGNDEGIRRSTRPSRVKDYAKMVRDHSKDDSDGDEYSDTEEEEEYKEIPSETRKRRPSFKPKTPTVVAPTSTSPAITPTPRKRGRPRKDAHKEVPEKVKKEENISSQTASQDPEEKSDTGRKSEKIPPSTVSTPIKSESTTSDTKSPSDLSQSPTRRVQTLKKVQIKGLPPGVKPLPLPVQARSPAERCEMQIGKKLVKVQKIVVTKADMEAMAKQGLLELKDGTMVLRPGVKLPTQPSALIKDDSVEASKKEKPTPTRCDIGAD